MTWWRAGAMGAAAAAVIWACGGGPGSGSVGTGPDAGLPDAGPPDAGPPDAGPPDAGPPDAGPPDAGPPDGGGGFVPPDPIAFPSAPNWTFLGPQNGGPHDVFQVTADQGGNIWVAGGADGLFLLRPGETKFQRFTLADGLHPYGYLGGDQAKFLGVPNGSPADPSPSLSATPVIAVEGGPPGVVFVGYQGKPGCEDAWDTDHGKAPLYGDPAVYKSGDADRVTLRPDGTLSVVHYDIFSGPGIVPPEPQGREKLCTIFRIVWNPSKNDVWFGGNHGFAWGDPNYPGNPSCDGQIACSGVVEHSHPAVNGLLPNGSCCALLTEDYRGVAPDPASGDVWFGGVNRTTKFHWGAFTGSPSSRFFAAAEYTENQHDVINPPACPSAATTPCYIHNRIDVWPDAKGEGFFPKESERTDDLVFGAAAPGDGSVYIGSGYLGLKHVNADGTVGADLTSRLASTFVGAVAIDSLDSNTLWVANRYAGGVDRLGLSNPSGDQHYALNVFGILANGGIEDVQMIGSGPSRKVLVGFRQTPKNAGFVAIYSGP
jgi:hypothetical protein